MTIVFVAPFMTTMLRGIERCVYELGSRLADTVMLTTDGSAVRDIVGKENTPIRWAIIGIADQ